MRLLPHGLCFALTIRIFIELHGSDVFNDSLLPAESNKFQWTESKLKRPRFATLISLRKYQLLLN